MRTFLFRTQPIEIATTDPVVVVFTKHFDGAVPVTVTVENEDLKAKVVTSDRWGSPHSKLEFEWMTGGTGGNVKTVTIVEDTVDPKGVDVDVVGNDFTLTIGRAVLAWQVIALAQEALEAAGMTVRLPHGSDGLAPVIPPRADGNEDPIVYTLSGGAAAVTTGAATVEVASKLEGPFVADSAAVTALSTVAEGSPKSHTFTAPVRVVRLAYAMGASATHVVASARKGDGS